MELIVFATLTALAGLFTIAAALSKDRTNLVPAGLIFILIGIFFVIGPGLEIQSGTSYTYSEVNGSMQVTEETINYRTVESPTQYADINESLGLGLTLIGLYFLLISTSKKRFYSLMSR